MNHNDIRHKLSDYIDDAVSAGEKVTIEEHLKTCVECSNALIELRKTLEQIKEIGEIESPAWMTGKIMAKVREEAERKKSLFERFFSPTAVKLPIQAVAVLFLTVTAYYIYQTINIADKYAEAPTKVASKKNAPSAGDIFKEEKKIQAPAPRSKKLSQEPEYKSPDMTFAYEKPAPPAPMKEEAPAPASPEQTESRTGAAPESKELLRGMAPEAARDESRLDFYDARKAKSAAPTTLGSTHEIREIKLSLSVADIARADKEVDKTLRDLKGTVIRKEGHADVQQLIVYLDSKMLPELREKLGRIGKLKEKESPADGYEGLLQVGIMLIPASRH